MGKIQLKTLILILALVGMGTVHAQYNPNQDLDGDGIINSVDLDDDNDGIPDLLESPPSTAVVNGTFTSTSAPWLTRGGTGGWQYSSGSQYVFIQTDNVSNREIYQSINNLNRTDGTVAITMRVGAQDGSNAAGSTATLQILLNGTLYATINNSTIRNTATPNITLTVANGATTNFTPYSTAVASGYTFQTFTLNIPYNSPATAELVYRATTVQDDWALDDVSIPAYLLDTDNDGIPNYQDLDSDNDGCLDAMEGDENVAYSMLVAAAAPLSVGTGSSAPNQNLCASGSCVDTQGVPIVVNAGGAADIGSDRGQGVGDSQNNAVIGCFCYKPVVTAGTALNTPYGITALGRAGTNTGNWPMVRKGAWTALEAKTKG
ncbi:thrombospondin type 3 repeat-containing protein, partial [Chryseobacterium pennipullorum]